MELDEIDFARAGAPDVGSPRKRKVKKEAEDPLVKPCYLDSMLHDRDDIARER